MKILLASNSPRRHALLQQMGFDFDTISVQCDESFPAGLPAAEVAAYISLKKANAYQQPLDNCILVTADTVVVLGDEILGKPKDENDAFDMLRKLSGKSHKVYTAFTLKTDSQTETFTDDADVFMDEIADDEIRYYIKNYTPLDKAGSYGIQDWLGLTKISKIEGNYYTIMGLPTTLLYHELMKLSTFDLKSKLGDQLT